MTSLNAALVSVIAPTMWIAFGAVVASIIAHRTKIAEFRQNWIHALRDDIALFVTQAQRWYETYLRFNALTDPAEKHREFPSLETLKYECLGIHRRIRLRTNRTEPAHLRLVSDLQRLLNPGSFAPPDPLAGWNALAQEVIHGSRWRLLESLA